MSPISWQVMLCRKQRVWISVAFGIRCRIPPCHRLFFRKKSVQSCCGNFSVHLCHVMFDHWHSPCSAVGTGERSPSCNPLLCNSDDRDHLCFQLVGSVCSWILNINYCQCHPPWQWGYISLDNGDTSVWTMGIHQSGQWGYISLDNGDTSVWTMGIHQSWQWGYISLDNGDTSALTMGIHQSWQWGYISLDNGDTSALTMGIHQSWQWG